jgi:hypothetical protein
MASGETNLDKMLDNLQPELEPAPYVFCTLSEGQFQALSIDPRGTFQEQEGVTVILTQAQAEENNLAFQGSFACITLSVHSSLQAVGLIAAVATRLADAGISVNPVAGYYHDHLFVPWDRRGEAMALLLALQKPTDPQDSNSHPRL